MARQYGNDEQARRRKIDRGVFAVIALILTTVILLMEAEPEQWAGIIAGQVSACNQLTAQQTEVPEGSMVIHMIDVGQGDSVFVQSKEANILIDAGEREAGDDVVDYLRDLGVRELDWVICTHPHSDHIGGMPAVFEAFEVRKVMVPDIPDTFAVEEKLKERLDNAIRDEGISPTTAWPGVSYELGDLTMTVLWPDPTFTGADLNDWSIGLKLSCGGVDFLTCGDLTEGAEDDLIMSAGVGIRAQIVKSNHHGSAYANGSDFLFVVLPELALISCGEDNDYGHPHDELLGRYEYYGIEWERTDVCGDIRVVCENGQYTIETQN